MGVSDALSAWFRRVGKYGARSEVFNGCASRVDETYAAVKGVCGTGIGIGAAEYIAAERELAVADAQLSQ